MIVWWRLVATAKSLQSCPTLCDPIDGSPPGSPVPGILQARTLEWVAISFSNARKRKVKVKSLSRVRLLAIPWTAAHQAPLSMRFSRQEYWSGVPLVECLLFTYMLRGTSLICICGLSAMGYFICIVSLNFHRKFTFIRVTNQPFSHFTKWLNSVISLVISLDFSISTKGSMLLITSQS